MRLTGMPAALLTPRLGWWRFLLALLLAHLAAAYIYAFDMLVWVAIMNSAETGLIPNSTSHWMGFLNGAFFLPLLAGAITIMTVFLLIPYTLLVSPFAFLLAKRAPSVRTMLLIGGVVGLALAGLKTWLCMRQLDTVPFELLMVFMSVCDGAVAGVAFAWIVWLIAIRPRLRSI